MTEQPIFTPPSVPPTPPPSAHGRRAWVGIAGVVALAAAFGAGLAVGRTTAPKATVAAAAKVPTALLHSSTATASSAASATSPTTAKAPSGTLASALLPVPSGGTAKTAPGSGADGSLTLAQYVAMLYPSTATTETSLLQARGFMTGATRWMDTAAGQELSIYLIEFQAPSGAQSYALATGLAHKSDSAYAGQTTFTVPGLTDGEGFETGTLDKYGNTDSFVYGAVGNVAIIVHCYTPGSLNRAGLLAAVSQQETRLTAFEG
ncbi:MAG TPA: hypothetical protein VL551_05340 [Actinospica sp.]|jgi:hypothetical protein|nr:hypothetical protein [Actinospica sp.]